MGIYDRDYYRRDGRSFLGSLSERGTICKWLIGINVACFVLQMLSTGHHPQRTSPITDTLELHVQAVMQGEVWRLLTYSFLHAVDNPWHIVLNMVVLYFFGRDVEDAYGPREFLAYYLTAALLGGVAFLATMPGEGRCIGASGAVMAVLVLAACREPSRILLLMFVFPCPIWLVVAFMVAKDAFEFLGGGHSGTAVQVHLAGSAFGFFYYQFHWRVTGWWPGFRTRWRRISRPKLRVYEEPDDDRYAAPVAAPVQSSSAIQANLDDEQLEAKMDAILEKISRVGKENITEGEREVLLRAGERIRRRRN